MVTENVETLVESQHFLEPPSKKRRTYGRETETEKENERSFSGPKRWLNTC